MGAQPGYIEILKQRTGSLSSKDYCKPKKIRYPKLRSSPFSVFFCVGKMQESGHIKIIPLLCTSVCGASILCFHILSFLRAHHGGVAAVC